MGKNLVIIPTYNEIENIEEIIRAIFSQSLPLKILVVDDNSPDGTAEKVKELQTEFPDKLFLEIRAEKAGLGTAYIHGFRWRSEERRVGTDDRSVVTGEGYGEEQK